MTKRHSKTNTKKLLAAVTPVRIRGVDLAMGVSSAAWSALVAYEQAQFAIVRCFSNGKGGVVDTRCVQTIANAITAGISNIGVYHFPVIQDKTAEEQIDESLVFLKKNNVSFNCYWLDVEFGSAWSKHGNENVAFIKRMVERVQAANHVVGIYCSDETWTTITGNSSEFKSLPLWWCSHNRPYSGIGSWPSPSIVQSKYNQKYAGLDYDGDYTLVEVPNG